MFLSSSSTRSLLADHIRAQAEDLHSRTYFLQASLYVCFHALPLRVGSCFPRRDSALSQDSMTPDIGPRLCHRPGHSLGASQIGPRRTATQLLGYSALPVRHSAIMLLGPSPRWCSEHDCSSGDRTLCTPAPVVNRSAAPTLGPFVAWPLPRPTLSFLSVARSFQC